MKGLLLLGLFLLSMQVPTLTARNTPTDTQLLVELKWTRVAGNMVDVYRNSSLQYSETNDGQHMDAYDSIRPVGLYQICPHGSSEGCTNIAKVTVRPKR